METHHLLLIMLANLFISSVFAQNNNTIQQERMINLDLNKIQGAFNTMFKECIGAGRANEGLRADWQQQLALVKKECDFKYIRMHGLLTDDMGVYKEDNDGNPEYNFQYIDVLYDYILGIGMKPFVELSFMPSALASGDNTVFWWQGNITPPKDYQKWERLIANLVQHFTERYGADEVKSWYFEVWNEPNLSGFWSGTQEEYFKLYKHTVQAIKEVNKAYRVGGPATAGAAWVPETIEFCAKNNVPLDYISTHTYGIERGYLDEFGKSRTILDNDKHSVSKDVLKSHREILDSAMPGLELHYTEWSSSYTPADPLHDSYQQAAFVLERLKQVGTAATSMSYWVFTDIFEEAGPRFTPFHGGFGLLNYQGIKKPAFYAYSYLNKLGETELVNSDSSSRACKNENGDVQILFWDCTYTLPDSMNNQDYFKHDLPAKSKGTVTVNISEVPQGIYKLEIYQIGYKVNDPYSAYYALNTPNQLTRKQVAEIKQQHDGSPISEETVTIDSSGVFSRDFNIRENDVFLVELVNVKK